MKEPSSLHLDLQCTGVTPAPTFASPRLPKPRLSDNAPKESLGACLSREPLQDSNTQPSPGGSSSQKRSNTSSESIDVTPSEKRPGTLPLSPKRPLGQQFNTLEIQRVLSLTPGKKPEFRHSLTQQSIQGGRSSPGSTAQANISPPSHNTNGSMRQQTASPQPRPCEEPADAPHILHDTCPATEPQLAGLPATQPVCAASALDLIMQATQVVMTEAEAADACQPKLVVHSAQHQSGPALGCKHATACESTPMLQMNAPQDTADVPHSRAPAGPSSSPALSHHGSREAEQAGGPLTSSSPATSAADGSQPAGEVHLKPALGGTAKADLMLPEARAEALVALAQAGTCRQSGRQQPQLLSRCLPEPAVALPPGTAPSLEPSSLATDMDTEDANLSQESLDGTQAEADALMEEAANAFMHGTSEEAEGCLMLNVSTTTLHEVVSALGRPCHTWRSQDLVKMERAIWSARLHEKLYDELACLSFEGTRIEASLPELSTWVQGELCDASEEAQRQAEWQATGKISCVCNQVPFSCSAAGSSADPLEPPQGSQLGTILEQAAAIISYSQVVPDHTSTAKGRLSVPGWLSQAAHHAQQMPWGKPEALAHAFSQTASAAVAGGALQSSPNKPDADVAAAAADGDAAARAAKTVCLPAQGDQEKGHNGAASASPPAALQSAASQSRAVQGLTQLHSAPAPASLTEASGTDATAVAPASESLTQAADIPTAAVLQDAPTQQALPAEAAEKPAAAHSQQASAVPAVEADKVADDLMSQGTLEDLGDVAATEVQVPAQASLLHAAISQTQRSPAPSVAPADTAGRRGNSTESAQPKAHQADAGAHPQAPVRAEACHAQAAPVNELPPSSQQMLPGSPTQDLHLHLQLTYMEPELAGLAGPAGDDDAGGHAGPAGQDHAGPAGEAASQQLCLQLATEPPPAVPEAHAEHAVRDESWQDGAGSPAGLDLNLDTQVPEQPNADKAASVRAVVGGHKSPALNRGWWAQPWSAAQHAQPAEDVDSFTAVGFWDGSNCNNVAAEGTEVTPSGLRPPRGRSLTPLPHLPSTGAAAKQSTSRSPGKSHGRVSEGRSPPPSLLIADSEDPLVLPRSNGPARKAFLEARTLPCSSPNGPLDSPAKSPAKSPTDPLCSFVPATADGTSPHKKVQKRSSPSKAGIAVDARTGRHGPAAAEGQLHTTTPAGPAVQDEQYKNGHAKPRHGKKKSKGKLKAAAPQMGPPGGRYRAGLPAPRYQSHSPGPRITPPSSSTRQLVDRPLGGAQARPDGFPPQSEAAVRSQQQQQRQKIQQGQGQVAMVPTCTMEQLPLGGSAFTPAFAVCTLEQLPSGSHPAPPAPVGSPVQTTPGVTSPAAVLRQGRAATPQRLQGQGQGQAGRQAVGHSPGQGQRQGPGQGLHGVGLLARNAAAAFCSARWQTAGPRNPYSFEDNPSEAADPDTAHSPVAPRRSNTSPGASGADKAAAEAQQAKHAGMGVGGRLLKGPPQQSRCKWQLKGSAQAAADEAQQQQKKKQAAGGTVPRQLHPAAVTAAAAAAAAAAARQVPGKACKKKKRCSGSIALDKPVRKRQPPPRWDDMVGHSQLESDMLEASPPPTVAAAADDDDDDDDDTSAQHGSPVTAAEAPTAQGDTHDKTEVGNGGDGEGIQNSPAPQAAAHGSPMPVPQPGRKRKRSSLCHVIHDEDAGPANLPVTAEPDEQEAEAAAHRRRSAQAISKLQKPRIEIPRLGCSKCRWTACSKCRSAQAEALEAAAAVQADIPAATTPAAADKQAHDKQPAAAAAATRPLRSSCPAGSAPPKKPATHSRKSRRHSSGQGVPGAAPANATAAPPAAAEEGRVGGVQVVQCSDRRVTFESPDQGAARRHSCRQGRADVHSPAVTAQRRHQPSTDSHRADLWQARTSLSSLAVGSGGPRQHRRASLGGGGVLPLAGYSFLLTGYEDEKQKKVVTQRIVKLGGFVLEDIPKPPGPPQSSFGGTGSHPVLAVIATIPKRTHKVMYACIKGIPTLQESWLTACLAAHKLLPFDAFQQDVTQRSEGHQAFQGLAIHLAGAPAFQHSWGKLIRHAGGEIVSGVGDVASPSKGWHHALQGPCHCILSELKQGTAEDQQVHRLARQLRVPVKDSAWAVVGFEEGSLPALSPTKSSPTKPCNPPASPSVALPSPALDTVRANQSGAALGPNHAAGAAAAAGRQAGAKRGSSNSDNATASAEVKLGGTGRAKKRRRSALVLPESQPQEEQEGAHKRVRARKGSRTPPAGLRDSAGGRLVHPGDAEEERHADGATAGSPNEVVEDSLEVGSCVADAAGDRMDDVSSADTGHHEHPITQQAQCERPGAQQAQHDGLQGQQPRVLMLVEQGRAVGVAGQLAGLGQLLSGGIQWVGSSIDPPTQLGLAPSHHQSYYQAFSRGGVEVKVGDCVEVSHLGDDTTHLLQLKALWSEPTQTRTRMQALGQYFYRAEDTRLQTRFPEQEVFSSDKQETIALAAIMCKCSVTYSASPAGNHIYHCHFTYDYETNSLSPPKFTFSC